MRAVIFGGTTEGRMLSHELSRLGAAVTVCVATEYGREEQGEEPDIEVCAGRMDVEAMCRTAAGAAVCIDATHPYAVQASQNIREACQRTGVRLLRLLRRASDVPAGTMTFASAAEAAAFLQGTEGNVMLTTGAKELDVFAPLGGERLFPRVLPLHGSLAACENAGIPHSNILALQGPFTEELNEAMLRQYHIQWLVTKDGGQAGGFAEKAEAASAAGIHLILICRPEETDGLSYEEVLEKCREMI